MSANLAEPIRDAVVASTAVATLLSTYLSSPAVFTRRPIPANAVFPVIIISPDITINDQDGVNDLRPTQIRDISIYGQNDLSASYRTVEQIGYLIRNLFHRNNKAIDVPNWTVVQITATGPIPAPTDDENTVGRLVTLTVQLASKD